MASVVVLLIGPPGAGKSVIGERLTKEHGLQDYNSLLYFVSVGERLRELRLVDDSKYGAFTSTTQLQQLQSQASTIISDACKQLKFEQACSASNRILILECIKELEDAQNVLRILKEEDLPLLQVLLVSADGHTAHAIRKLVHSSTACSSEARDAARHVAERRGKWAANAAPLIQLFSAMGVLAEVCAIPSFTINPSRSKQIRRGHWGLVQAEGAQGQAATRTVSLDARTASPPFMLSPITSLASQGYARHISLIPPAAAAAAAAAAERPTAGPSRWLLDAGWCSSTGELALLPGLTAWPIEPVVSARQETDAYVANTGLSAVSAAAGLNMSNPGHTLPIPSRSVACMEDAAWLAFPGRYSVARKCDGMRALLHLTDDSGEAARLISRSGTVFTYPIASSTTSREPPELLSQATSTPTPPTPQQQQQQRKQAGTVLDGELIWVGSGTSRQGFFLVFDALSVGGRVVWSLPLAQRTAAMLEGLQIVEAEQCVPLKAAAAAAAADNTHGPSSTPSRSTKPTSCTKKQQAAPIGSDSIMLVYKQHLPVTAAVLQQLESSKLSCPYPTDGLVFTPNSMLYALGMQELLFKWQPAEQVGADIRGSHLNSKYQGLAAQPDLVYECVWNKRRWVPITLRWDKNHGNTPGDLESLKHADALSYKDLVQAVGHVQSALQSQGGDSAAAALLAGGGGAAATACIAAADPSSKHLAQSLPFDELYTQIMQGVSDDAVERTVDTATGLYIFNYKLSTPPANPVWAACRGLVLHPESRRVVAMPISRFGELQDDLRGTAAVATSVAAHGAAPRERMPLERAGTSNSAFSKDSKLHQAADLFSTLDKEQASASVKVDGSLVVAFLWEGQILATTRRRVDSEQAIWATAWLRANARVEAAEPGWTYMFEAVYPQNRHVVSYSYEGMVLLAVMQPDGHELKDLKAKAQVAHNLGVLPCPSLQGPVRELQAQLPRLTSAHHELLQEPQGDLSLAKVHLGPVSYEGWVIDQGSSRHKVVQQGYKVCSLAAQLMHPLAVWDAICCGGCSYGGLSRGLPQHFQAELHSIVDALWHNYSAVAELVQGVVSAAITACVAAGDQICAAGSPALVAAAQEEAERGTPDAQAKVEATTAALRALAGLEDAAEAGAEQKDESAAADSVAARKRACLVAAAAAAAAAAQAAHGVPPEAFVKALCCALSTLCTQPPAMFYDQSQSGQSQTLSYKQSLRGKSSKGRCPPQLRCLLLECVKPQVDGHLPGYAPSPSFAQTFAKGWAKGPEVGRIAEMVNRPPSWLDLPDDLGLSVLSHLEDGKDLARVLLASKDLSLLLWTIPDCASKMQEAAIAAVKHQAAAAMRKFDASDCFYDSLPSYFSSYGNGDYDSDGFLKDGYGST